MRHDVAKDMNQSAADFRDIVWPKIARHIGGGELRQVEFVTDIQFAKELDMHAGIDAWQVADGKIRGIASRVQRSYKSHNTFTIRDARRSGRPTERQKRNECISEIERGWLIPHLTIQAYIHKGTGEFMSCAICKTVPLYQLVEEQIALPADDRIMANIPRNCIASKGGGCIYKDSTSNADFIVVPWATVAMSDVKITIVPKKFDEKFAKTAHLN